MSDEKELTDQCIAAGRKWAAAHAEAHAAASYDSDRFREVSRRTGAVKEEMERTIARLINETHTKGILDEVLRFLRKGNEQATLYVVNHYV